MPRQFVPLRSFALKSRLVATFLVLASVALLPSLATAAIVVANPLSATQTFGDDVHTSVGVPLTAIAHTAGNDKATDSGGLISVSTAAFAAANAGWTFTWGTDQANVAKAMDGTYYTWVVSAPTKVMAGGDTYNDPNFVDSKGNNPFQDRYGKANQNEIGGALINLTTNFVLPTKADHTYSLHWIQALTGTAYGVAPNPNPKLDNPFATNGTPFYDDGGAAGVDNNGNPYFLDIPNAFEDPGTGEYEQNPIISRTFQMVLALDDQTTVNSVVQNSVTLLGGYQWGYTYTAMDTPEPATLVIWGSFVGLGFVVHRRRRSRAPPGRMRPVTAGQHNDV